MIVIISDDSIVPVPDQIWWRAPSNPAVESNDLAFLHSCVIWYVSERRSVVLFIHLATRDALVRHIVLLSFPVIIG